MAKLNSLERELARIFKEEIADMRGEIFYSPETGISMAFVPHDNMGRFVRVSIAYCSENDKFSKKRARLVLRDRVYEGNYIIVPRKGRAFTHIAFGLINVLNRY